jgi:predicted Zn-dependent peptidase
MLSQVTSPVQLFTGGWGKAGHLLAALLLLLAIPISALGELPWQEVNLTGGPRLMAVDTGSETNVAISFYFRGGTARADGQYELARLAPWVFLGGVGEGGSPFTDRLQDLGWLYKVRVDRDGAGVFLAGPNTGMAEVMTHLQDRLGNLVPVKQADLDRGWREVERVWDRLAGEQEVVLRHELDRLYYGDHPYSAGTGDLRPASLTKPTPGQLGSFMASYYRPLDLLVLAAGALDPARFLGRWSQGFDVSINRNPLPVGYPGLEPGRGRVQLPSGKGETLLILRFPGPAGLENDGIASALLAGVMTRLLQSEILDIGLAGNCSAWFDFMAPGPRPIEVQVRHFHPGDVDKIEAMLLKISRRLRQGEFSRFHVISAKDFILESLDSSSKIGGGPVRNSAGALINWSQTVAWRNLYFEGWALDFETALLGTGRERIQLEARKRLVPEDAIWGSLIPANDPGR